MNSSKYIRNQFGLSQPQLAQYLKIALSQLAMFEKGKRDLPTAALVQLAAMELFLTNESIDFKMPDDVMKYQNKDLEKYITKQILELEFKHAKLLRQQDILQKKQDQNVKLFQFANHLKQNKLEQANNFDTLVQGNLKNNFLITQAQQNMQL